MMKEMLVNNELDEVIGGATYALEKFTNGDKLTIDFKNTATNKIVRITGEFKNDVFEKLAAYDKAHGEKSVKIISSGYMAGKTIFQKTL